MDKETQERLVKDLTTDDTKSVIIEEFDDCYRLRINFVNNKTYGVELTKVGLQHGSYELILATVKRYLK